MEERLTKKISKAIQDKYSLGSYLYYDFANADDTNKLLNKLGAFEDFMEEYNFDGLQHLGFTLEEQNKIIEAYEQENQTLKDRWEKLKDILEKDIEHNQKEYDESFCTAFNHYSASENWVLDRMEELEQGECDAKD